MLRKTIAKIPATPHDQPDVTLYIPEGEEIDVDEAGGAARAGQRRVHWKKQGGGMRALYVSEEDIDNRTVAL
jgi:hypothetical protein